jgi:hypothetical protein
VSLIKSQFGFGGTKTEFDSPQFEILVNLCIRIVYNTKFIGILSACKFKVLHFTAQFIGGGHQFQIYFICPLLARNDAVFSDEQSAFISSLPTAA